MARRSSSSAKDKNLERFFEVLAELEQRATDMDFRRWTARERSDAVRRFTRLMRAIRHVPPDELVVHRRYGAR